MILLFRRSTLVTSLLVLQAHPARAQAPTGSIEGFVRDSAGHPLVEAQVSLLGIRDSRSPSQSNANGAYVLRLVPVGQTRLWVGRVGFLPETLTVIVASGQTAHADVALSRHVILDPDIILADPTRGKMGPFHQRMARGVGSFVTRAEIEKRQPSSISELLRTLPGVHISQRMAGEPQPIDMQRSRSSSMQSTCVVQLYVDGQPYPNGNVDDFAPLTLEGVEVYRSASEIPADFRTRNATCGLISLWTRDPEAARRRP